MIAHGLSAHRRVQPKSLIFHAQITGPLVEYHFSTF